MMNEETLNSAERLVPKSYLKLASNALKTRENKLRHLLEQRKLPEEGWDDLTIETLLLQLSSMDSNNFSSTCGVGEREGRFASGLVARRHFNFSHGIGRSGDLTEPQPKAAGSSLIYKLTNTLLADIIKVTGIDTEVECLLVPVATGMSIVLSLLALKQLRPHSKYVIWPRIDQKSCFKSILTAGLIPIVIDNIENGESLTTDCKTIEQKLKELGSDSITCVISTTSCFAPRVCDNIENIAILSQNYNIPHIINNAYGLQSTFIMKKISRARRKGRVDIFIQSCDKNLMVPVGGAIISSFNAELLARISKVYPGRASFSPVLDTFITILSLGKNGYIKLMKEQVKMYKYLHQQLTDFAKSIDERILETQDNPFSIAMTLSKIEESDLTKLGSMLFTRNVTGARVVTTKEIKNIGDYNFNNWGCHSNTFHTPYITSAATIGMETEDVDLFIKKLKKVFNKIKSS